MATHDYDIANASGASVRADMNLLFAAIASNNSKATAPTTTFANMWWFDTANNLMKQRDEANTGWITAAEKDATNWKPYWNTGLLSATFLEQANAVGQQTIWLPASAWTPTTTNGAARGTVELATNDIMLNTLDFDTATLEKAQFSLQFPKSWDESTGLIMQPIWTHASTTTNFGVAWGIVSRAFANDDPLDTALGGEQLSVDTGGTTNDLYIGPESSAHTVQGSPGAEEFTVLEIFRKVGDAGDTMAIDARLLGVRLHFTTDAVRDN